MNVVVSSLYTAALTLCLFSAGLLGQERNRRNGAVAWLTWFLVIEAMTFAFELLMAHPATPLKGLWLGLRLATSLLIAPCLWLAVKEIVEGTRPPLRTLGRAHLRAIGIGLLCTIPLIADAHLGTDYFNPQEPTTWLHARFIHTTMLGCIGIFAVQAPIFLLRCRRLLQPLQPGSPLWVQFLLPIVATTWALGLLRTLQCATHAPEELLLVCALLEAGVAVGAIYILIQRSRLPPVVWVAPDEPVASVATLPAAADREAATGHYARSSLTPVIRDRIRRKVRHALETDRLYRDPSLSLRALAEGLKENPHYLSQVLNQDLGSNFYDLVNQCRIEEAKALLLASPERTVLEIALAVGFNSKSTFHTAFRRHAGTTPSAFREKTVGNENAADPAN
jgi:AraC-like DNA-binding protein